MTAVSPMQGCSRKADVKDQDGMVVEGPTMADYISRSYIAMNNIEAGTIWIEMSEEEQVTGR